MAARRITRRALLAMLAAVPVAGPTLAASFPTRVVSLDYALAETLIAIGRPPFGLANVPGWSDWVVEPPLPAGTIDVGLDLDPNLELLAELAPDLILTTDYTSRAESALRRIAPVERLTIYAQGQAPLERAAAVTLRLGERLGADAEARRYLAETERFFDACARRARRLPARPLLLASIMDARHARVYGSPGLYAGVLERIGLGNAWDEPTSFWGFSTVGVERLAGAAAAGEARFVTFDPLPPDALPALSRSPIWTSLPFVRAGRVSRLPSILMFGALPAARRFAGLLLAELEARAA